MNILAIGNSFSQDATRYIHQIARADGVELNVANLYISGCPLVKHFQNIMADAKEYELDYNGSRTLFKVTLKEALLNREWDYITVQQASGYSINYDAYQPYLNELVAYVKKYAPKAKIGIHETWAYEQGSEKLGALGYTDHKDMYNDLKLAYEKAEKDINAEFVIKSGTLLQKLIDRGMGKVHRDTFHATLGAGRYAIGLLWYKTLTGNDVVNNTFCDFDEEVTDEQIKLIKECI